MANKIAVFLVKSLSIGALFYAASCSSLYSQGLHRLAGFNARIAFALLRPFDSAINMDGDTLWSATKGSAVTVHTECTGYEIVSIVAVFMLAYPASIRAKVVGICGAAVAMATLNLARIVSVYWISTNYPGALDVVHEEIWPVIFNVSSVISLVVWFMWLKKDEHHPASVAA